MMRTRPLTSFTRTLGLVLAASAWLAGSAAAELAVRAIDPPRPASGQVALIVADALPTLDERDLAANLRVLVEQDGVTSEAFVFQSAVLPGAVYVRLPAGLRPGPALVAFALGDETVGEPLDFEVSRRAAAPTLWGVYPYGGHPVTVAGNEGAPTLHAGDRVVLVGTGMDTTGVTAILRYADGTDRLVPAFTQSSPAVGVAAVLDLPADLPAGSVHLSARVRVCEPLEGCQLVTTSPESEPVDVTLQ
jgi:hypothetical protein